ncbi:MAG TPA: hypothetical protein VK249_23760, partial [Anaerolineales bacterium]|nr:hypothetical protein [Anaerolineales bacterium]
RIPPKNQYHLAQESFTILVNANGIHLITMLPNTSQASREAGLIELGVEFVKAHPQTPVL